MAHASAASVDRPIRAGRHARLALIAVFLSTAMPCASWPQEPTFRRNTQTIEQTASAETIVLAFPLSASPAQIDAVGQHYGLQLLERKVSQVLDQHLIVFRVPADRDANDLLRQLAADARIASAQLNRQYGPVDPAARAPLVANAVPREKVAKAASSQSVKSREGRPPRASAGMAQVAAVAPPRTASLGGGMRWPAADEPFLGPGGRNR
jgi:hypothetical protein